MYNFGIYTLRLMFWIIALFLLGHTAFIFIHSLPEIDFSANYILVSILMGAAVVMASLTALIIIGHIFQKKNKDDEN